MALLVAALGAYAYASAKVRGDRPKIEELQAKLPNGPLTVLILGSDSREGLTPEELKKFDPEGVDRKTGRRADTIILLHLDAKANKAVLVHFPRDLRVKLPGGQLGRINGSYQKGPGAVVQTVSDFTGMPINHYVEVNFSGFNGLVNALGGVNVFFERPIKEPDSGLNAPKGCVELKGDQALAFVRVRKIDDDFGRIERQQLFLKLMMEKLTKARTLLNPVKVVRLANQISKNVTTDADLKLTEMKSLAFALKGFDSSRLDLRVVPSSHELIGGVSYVEANRRQSDALFAALRDGQPLPDFGRTGVSAIEPRDVEVTVFNGTKSPGLARIFSEDLKAKGFSIFATGDGPAHNVTALYFNEGSNQKAELVSIATGIPVKPKPSALEFESSVALVIGQDRVPKGSPGPGNAQAPPAPAPLRPKPAEPKPLIHACD